MSVQPIQVQHSTYTQQTEASKIVFLRVEDLEEPLTEPTSLTEWILQLGEILENTEYQDDALSKKLRDWAYDFWDDTVTDVERHVGEKLDELDQLLGHSKDLVIYKGIVLEYAFLKKYFEYCGPAVAPIYTHFLAKRLGNWLRGLEKFLGVEEDYAASSQTEKTFHTAAEYQAEFERIAGAHAQLILPSEEKLEELKVILSKYPKEEWTDALSRKIRNWAKTDAIIALLEEILIEDPVLYDGIYLENKLMQKIVTYCQPLISHITIHDFAIEIIQWAQPLRIKKEEKKVELILKNDPILMAIFGAAIPIVSGENYLLPGMHKEHYLKELETLRVIQNKYIAEDDAQNSISHSLKDHKKRTQSNIELAKQLSEILQKGSHELLDRIEKLEKESQERAAELQKNIEAGNQQSSLLRIQLEKIQRDIAELKQKNATLTHSNKRVADELKKAKSKKKRFLGIRIK